VGHQSRKQAARKTSAAKKSRKREEIRADEPGSIVGSIRLTLKAPAPRIRFVLDGESLPTLRSARDVRKARPLAVTEGTHIAAPDDAPFVAKARTIEYGTAPSFLYADAIWNESSRVLPPPPIQGVAPAAVAGRRSVPRAPRASWSFAVPALQIGALVAAVVLLAVGAWFGVQKLMGDPPRTAVAGGPSYPPGPARKAMRANGGGSYSGGTSGAAAGRADVGVAATAPATARSCYSSLVLRTTVATDGGTAANSVQLLDGKRFAVNSADAADAVGKLWPFQRVVVCSQESGGVRNLTVGTGDGEARSAVPTD